MQSPSQPQQGGSICSWLLPIAERVFTHAALKAALALITDTAPPVFNETPSVNGNARFIAVVSTGDLTGLGTNSDGNREIFHIDRKKHIVMQITDSVTYDNLHPNLRAAKGNLLVFDSTANLIPDRCVSTQAAFLPCTTNADCDGSICGNPENNREVFEWVRVTANNAGEALRQLTAAATGDSFSPSQAKSKVVAFAFNGDHAG